MYPINYWHEAKRRAMGVLYFVLVGGMFFIAGISIVAWVL
jgi:hypothetical protein